MCSTLSSVNVQHIEISRSVCGTHLCVSPRKKQPSYTSHLQCIYSVFTFLFMWMWLFLNGLIKKMLWHKIYFNNHFSLEYININVAKNAWKINFIDCHQNEILLLKLPKPQIDERGKEIFDFSLLLEYSISASGKKYWNQL